MRKRGLEQEGGEEDRRWGGRGGSGCRSSKIPAGGGRGFHVEHQADLGLSRGGRAGLSMGRSREGRATSRRAGESGVEVAIDVREGAPVAEKAFGKRSDRLVLERRFVHRCLPFRGKGPPGVCSAMEEWELDPLAWCPR